LGDGVIETDVAGFLSGQVMIVVATRDSALRTYIGRGCSARFVEASGQIEILVSASQWTDAVRHARPGSPIAATFVQPDNYKAFQVKGRIADCVPASAEEQARAVRYVEAMLEILRDLGVSQLQLSSTLVAHDLARISYWPTDVFTQTPGPEAGRRRQAAAWT
jgi:hypothetical protein